MSLSYTTIQALRKLIMQHFSLVDLDLMLRVIFPDTADQEFLLENLGANNRLATAVDHLLTAVTRQGRGDEFLERIALYLEAHPNENLSPADVRTLIAPRISTNRTDIAPVQMPPVEVKHPSAQTAPVGLQNEMIHRFDLSEIEDICFALGIDFELLAPGHKGDKVRSLLQYALTHNLLGAVIDQCYQHIPEIEWPTV